MKQAEVTVEISTKDRYDTTLPLALLAVANQTYKPTRVVVFDDGAHEDLRQRPLYNSLFSLFYSKGIECEVVYGQKKGQVYNHQAAIEIAKTELIWRVDDDDTPEADVLAKLVDCISEDDIGGAAGLILMPGNVSPITTFASSKIEHILYRPNIQWFRFGGVREVDHFNNSFLFKVDAAKKAGGYFTGLSPVCHREETLFTYGLRRVGYRLLVDPSAVTWHLRSPSGGIRSHTQEFFYQHDEGVFMKKMEEYGVKFRDSKLIVLDCGLGDHYAFKMMLPELKRKHRDADIVLSVCYPEVFEDEGLELISIADAKLMLADEDFQKHNIYRYMIDQGWTGRLVDAYRKFLL